MRWIFRGLMAYRSAKSLLSFCTASTGAGESVRAGLSGEAAPACGPAPTPAPFSRRFLSCTSPCYDVFDLKFSSRTNSLALAAFAALSSSDILLLSNGSEGTRNQGGRVVGCPNPGTK